MPWDIEAVSSHTTQQTSYVTMDPKLRHELDLVEHLVMAGKDVDVPYTTYLTNGRGKKLLRQPNIKPVLWAHLLALPN